MEPFVVHVARLRRVLGTRWHEVRTGPADPEGVIVTRSAAESSVPEDADAVCEATLESFAGGVMVTGTVTSPWRGTCRRCTVPLEGTLRIDVRERFCDVAPGSSLPEDEDAYPIVDDVVDLAPMVRDAVVLELPLAPLCRPECRGLCPYCGIDLNVEACGCEPPVDPRWASLDVLRSDSSAPRGAAGPVTCEARTGSGAPAAARHGRGVD